MNRQSVCCTQSWDLLSHLVSHPSHLVGCRLSFGVCFHRNFRRLFFIFLFKPVFSIFFKLSFLGPTFDQLMSWDEWLFVLAENLADFFVISGVWFDSCTFLFCIHLTILHDLNV